MKYADNAVYVPASSEGHRTRFRTIRITYESALVLVTLVHTAGYTVLTPLLSSNPVLHVECSGTE